MLDSWQQFLREQGANIGAHAGALTCNDFAPKHAAAARALAAQLTPTQNNSLLADLSHQGVLAVRGKDAIKFLQGYLTCDVPSLSAGPAAGALCNLQGRMTSNFLAFIHEDGVLLRMHRSLVPRTQAVLAKYIVFSKAHMTDESDRWIRLGLAGPHAAQSLVQFTHDTTQDNTQLTAQVSTAGSVVLALTPGARFELWLPPALAEAGWLALRTDARAVDVWQWEALDVVAGRAWLTATTSDEYLPQMFNLDALGAINFNKGCYLGQEIVTRAQHRGGVKRRLVLGACAATDVQIGDPVQHGDTVVGQIVALGRTPVSWVANAVISHAAMPLPLQVRNANFALENLPYPLGT